MIKYIKALEYVRENYRDYPDPWAYGFHRMNGITDVARLDDEISVEQFDKLLDLREEIMGEIRKEMDL